MKKVILILTLGFSSFGLALNLNAACYEPTYLATKCETQGWDNCVNYDCDDIITTKID